MKPLLAPFPYFGGKSRIAGRVWDALGTPDYYIEPFFGSGAVLLNRPHYIAQKHLEIVCDKSAFVSNAWRAMQFNPDETAKWADWPMNHADLMARKKRLKTEESGLLERLVADDMWCDPKLAGYWIWMKATTLGEGMDAHRTRPSCFKANSLYSCPSIRQWLHDLQMRLRHVRVVCGDWTSVCTMPGIFEGGLGLCGFFMDPPYGVTDRDGGCYSTESFTVAHDVRAWCIEHGQNPHLRIVLAGYEEHDELAQHGWRKETWKTAGYLGGKKSMANRTRETIWFSPFCLDNQPCLL